MKLTRMGGLEKNKHEIRKLHAGRGGTGTSIVVRVKERRSSRKGASFLPNRLRWEHAVPITFLDKHNPDQFEIVCSDTDAKGKRKYERIVIRRRK